MDGDQVVKAVEDSIHQVDFASRLRSQRNNKVYNPECTLETLHTILERTSSLVNCLRNLLQNFGHCFIFLLLRLFAIYSSAFSYFCSLFEALFVIIVVL